MRCMRTRPDASDCRKFCASARVAVVARLLRLQPLRLEQHRAELTGCLHPIDALHLRRQCMFARTGPRTAKLRQDLAPQRVASADVQEDAVLTMEAIDAGR